MAYQNEKVKARQTVMNATTQNQTIGIVSEVPMGAWNTTTQYQKLNKVRYVSVGGSGVTLLAKKASKGIEPFVSQGWQDVWMIENYDGGAVIPNGTYPEMTVGNAVQAENDGAGKNIANQFSEVVSDIQGLREDINTESHFRGMFESVAALQAAYPTATPNDYAYIVGGNIYIWQNDAWTDSGRPSPNTAVPASDSIPLMDGVGSAGVSSAYARGDHRHPSDTNKVNKSGDTMTGKLDMAGNAAIWNGNDSTFIEIGKVGQSGFEFHSQSNPDVYRDYDALIQSYEAQSETQNGSAAMRYIAREHNFSGGGIFENGQRVYSANNLPSSLFIQDTRNTDEFNEDIFPGRRLVPFFTNVNMPTNDWWSGIYVKGWQDHYKAWQLVGDASNNFAYDRPLYVREIDTVNKTAKGWQALLSVDPSKLEPTTANGWTVGDKKLAISSDGIYLVSVNNSEAGIMIVSSSTTVNILMRVGVAFVYNYSPKTFYVQYSQAGDSLMTWLAHKCSDDSKVEIDSVAYKKIA